MPRRTSGSRIVFRSFSVMFQVPGEIPHTLTRFAYTPHINVFGGRSTPQLKLVDFETY